jgi:hypothetical protein
MKVARVEKPQRSQMKLKHQQVGRETEAVLTIVYPFHPYLIYSLVPLTGQTISSCQIETQSCQIVSQ